MRAERSGPSADLRHDPLTRSTSLVAPSWETPKPAGPSVLPLELPAGSRPCPFCPEQMDDPRRRAGEETARRPGGRRHPAWSALALRNRWPHTRDPRAAEVVVLSDLHDTHLGAMPLAEAAAALDLVLERSRVAEAEGAHPLVFLNHGTNAGASQPHPHAQVVGLPEPDPLSSREAPALDGGGCVLCEPAAPERLVARTRAAAVVTPVAPTIDFEQLVVLEEHARTSPDALAHALSLALGALYRVTGPVAYNLLFHLGAHPHVHVAPRIARHSGYELAGIHTCYVDPAEATARLAAAAADLGGPDRRPGGRETGEPDAA